ncbi:50S ribosomal protein L18Ae [Methanogenium organophilum]|uniref:Large ribosomal subunit protein eL20 n=1 Tax=Methanogenium organophilum TaxID=2199 RepID=A0A9X9T7S7_METOG|nr:50S ribosomal protein L18Ae [Methanogenium organophilum]WAI00716.1 50S ribosomal protein L18Ae [Methanogenium organophilum]
MEDKNFEITGDYRERDEWKPFTKVIAAPNEKVAEERAFTVIGSKHRLKRNYIKINAITLTDGE